MALRLWKLFLPLTFRETNLNKNIFCSFEFFELFFLFWDFIWTCTYVPSKYRTKILSPSQYNKDLHVEDKKKHIQTHVRKQIIYHLPDVYSTSSFKTVLSSEADDVSRSETFHDKAFRQLIEELRSGIKEGGAYDMNSLLVRCLMNLV